MRPQPSAIKRLAEELRLPIYQPERIKDEVSQEKIRAANHDVLVVVSYGQILPAGLIDAPRLGTINVHASLLPQYRGPAPVEWAILNGDAQTGVTIMQMDPGVDTGPILAQEMLPISPRETAAQLEHRLAEAGGGLLVRTLPQLQAGSIRARPQPAEAASHARRLKSEDGRLDPGWMTAEDIDRRVRALAERVGTWMRINGSDVKIFSGRTNGADGEGVPVETARGTYLVEQVQPPGGRRMSAAAWIRGKR
jgi:methionyl-tRNA formyltransferase